MLQAEMNEFVFEFDKATLDGGFYYVAPPQTGGDDNFFATEGADKSQIEGKHEFTKDGTVGFQFNRKLSEDGARWFVRRCPSNKNTFGKQPNELHFAVEGQLVFYRTYESGHRYYVFDNVCLAQGYSKPRNNWWFGGKNCFYIPSSDDDWQNTVVMAGSIRKTSADGERVGHVLMRVKRGDNSGVYTAKVTILHEEIDNAQS